MSGPMVRATLREVAPKTQTRRLVTGRGVDNIHTWNLASFERGQATFSDGGDGLYGAWCPYGEPCDRLWVRETFARDVPGCEEQGGVSYRADHNDPRGDGPANPMRWTPAIHMPRALSRIDLEIVAVRVERLHDITDKDARAEGVAEGRIPVDDYGPERIGYVLGDDDGRCVLYPTPREAFARGWDSINGDRIAWASNPWVWVIEYKRVRP